MLDRSHWNIIIHPARGTGFAKSVQDEALAYGMHFAGDLNLPFFIPAFGNGRFATTAIEASTFCNGFQFPKEEWFSGFPFSLTKIQRLSGAFSRRFF